MRALKRARKFVLVMLLCLPLSAPNLIDPPEAKATARQAWKILRATVNIASRQGWRFQGYNSPRLIRKGGVTSRTFTLYRGVPYEIVSSGCYDAYDIDLYLYDEWGRLTRYDRTYKRTASVTITPKWTGRFTAVIKMANSTWDGAHWALLIGYKL